MATVGAVDDPATWPYLPSGDGRTCVSLNMPFAVHITTPLVARGYCYHYTADGQWTRTAQPGLATLQQIWARTRELVRGPVRQLRPSKAAGLLSHFLFRLESADTAEAVTTLCFTDKTLDRLLLALTRLKKLDTRIPAALKEIRGLALALTLHVA